MGLRCRSCLSLSQELFFTYSKVDFSGKVVLCPDSMGAALALGWCRLIPASTLQPKIKSDLIRYNMLK